MSTLSSRLGQRVITPSVLTGDEHQSTLAEPRGAQRGVSCDVRGDVDASTARRMVDLGFAPGTEVQMVRRAPLADPVIFRVSGYEIALRRAQARYIHVVVAA